MGAHGVQEVGNVDHVRLFGAVFDDGLARGFDRREHEVYRCPYGGNIEIDVGADQISALVFGNAVHRAELGLNVDTQRLKTFQMLVDRPRAEIAPAGQRDFHLAETAEQRAHEIIRAAELADHVVQRGGRRHAGGIDAHYIRTDPGTDRSHLFEYFKHQFDVDDVGQIFYSTRSVREQYRGKYSHCCVFAAADVDFTVQRDSAFNYEFFQLHSPFFVSRPPSGSAYHWYFTGQTILPELPRGQYFQSLT